MLHYNPQHVSLYLAHLQEDKLYFYSLWYRHSLYSTVCRWRADCSQLSTSILYNRLQRVTIPDAVIIQFVLVKIGKVLLKTC